MTIEIYKDKTEGDSIFVELPSIELSISDIGNKNGNQCAILKIRARSLPVKVNACGTNY